MSSWVIAKMIKSDFYIAHARFQDLSNKALDWFIRSWNFKVNSDEWRVCLLKQKILNRKAGECLADAVKELKNG